MAIKEQIQKLSVGTIVGAASAKILEFQDECPKLYSDAELLDAMINAHQFADNEQDRASLLHTNGIGTAATRSDVINELVSCKYIVIEKSRGRDGIRNEISITELGVRVDKVTPFELKSVSVTAKWELLFSKIEKGKIEPNKFGVVIRKFVTSLVEVAFDVYQKQVCNHAKK